MSQQTSLEEFKKSVATEMKELYGYCMGTGDIQQVLGEIPENIWQELYKGNWDALDRLLAR